MLHQPFISTLNQLWISHTCNSGNITLTINFLLHREAIESRPDEDELGDHSGECSKLQEAHTEKIKDLTGDKDALTFVVHYYGPCTLLLCLSIAVMTFLVHHGQV